MPLTFTRRQACFEDLEALVELRLLAMRPSLETAGRFNPTRARKRFIDEFSPEHTVILLDNDQLIGCFALIPRDDHLYMAHFYLLPAYQGRGIGKALVEELQAKALDQRKDIYLTALSHSDAEQFYARRGFQIAERGEIDAEMVWRCTQRR